MIEELYQSFYTELVKWCNAMTQNLSAAEDIIQETFIRAMKNSSVLETLSHNQRRAWLYRTAKNLFIDKVRHDQYENIVEEIPEASNIYNPYEEKNIEQVLERIPEEEKMLFVMRYFQGYNSTELGKIFGMSPSAIRMKLSNARRLLRKELEMER